VKFDDILSEWEKDSDIDITEIGDEIIKIPKLHHKYYKIYIAEKANLKILESQLKTLKLEKHEFYTQGHNEETRKRGWELPPKGLILKSDIPLYMDSDKDIIEKSLKIGTQQEKVDTLEFIIKSLTNRGYWLRTYMDWLKFKNGG
jgi:hypothetical protein